MKVDSPEYKALMKKWSDESFVEETQRGSDEYAEHQANYHCKVVKTDKDDTVTMKCALDYGSVTCTICGKVITKTHRMQTLSAQLQGHLRSAHKMTIREARVASFKYKIKG